MRHKHVGISKVGFLIIALVLFWAGFVSSISFMEAWLKFRAPGVTLSTGLSIGKKVFASLNIVEWCLLTIYIVFAFYYKKMKHVRILIVSLIIVLILIIQTFVLLPQLSERADIIISGDKVGKSFLHVYFGTLELIKVTGLFYLGYYYYQLGDRRVS